MVSPVWSLRLKLGSLHEAQNLCDKQGNSNTKAKHGAPRHVSTNKFGRSRVVSLFFTRPGKLWALQHNHSRWISSLISIQDCSNCSSHPTNKTGAPRCGEKTLNHTIIEFHKLPYILSTLVSYSANRNGKTKHRPNCRMIKRVRCDNGWDYVMKWETKTWIKLGIEYVISYMENGWGGTMKEKVNDVGRCRNEWGKLKL